MLERTSMIQARGTNAIRTRPILGAGVRIAALSAIAIAFIGCKASPPPPKPVARYKPLPLKKVPPFLEGTILQHADLVGTDPLSVSSYGLVSHLRGTGDSTAPTAVRTWMINQMTKRGFGMERWGFSGAPYEPEAILQDPAFAIVRVDGYLPPGARQGQTFDVFVSALPEGHTSSLAHGELYETEMSIGGAEVGGTNIHTLAIAGGPIFVNPAYTLAGHRISNEGKISLRYGVLMDGGVVSEDRALGLRLRQPQRSLSEHIGDRINERFQSIGDVLSHGGSNVGQYIVAVPEDEGRVIFYVPKIYRGDWEHFAGVVTHLYLRGGSEFGLMKAQQLARAAVQPNAPLQDITYAWEGIGKSALPAVEPLMTDTHPDVAFAAARAAAFLNDPTALPVLMQIAKDSSNAFQDSAVSTLAALPPSQPINQMLRQILNVDNAEARIAAYQALARNKDSYIFSRVVQERFVLDIVPSEGPTLIYASRTGVPRIAIIGKQVSIRTPLMLSAMDGRLTMSSVPQSSSLSIYFRGPELPTPEQAVSAPELAELIARLAGEGTRVKDAPPLDFSYSEIVAVLQSLSDSHNLVVDSQAGTRLASFVLQDLANRNSVVYNAPVIATGPDTGTGFLPPLNPKALESTPSVIPGQESRPQ